jgi:hypothetical protein
VIKQEIEKSQKLQAIVLKLEKDKVELQKQLDEAQYANDRLNHDLLASAETSEKLKAAHVAITSLMKNGQLQEKLEILSKQVESLQNDVNFSPGTVATTATTTTAANEGNGEGKGK